MTAFISSPASPSTHETLVQRTNRKPTCEPHQSFDIDETLPDVVPVEIADMGPADEHRCELGWCDATTEEIVEDGLELCHRPLVWNNGATL